MFDSQLLFNPFNLYLRNKTEVVAVFLPSLYDVDDRHLKLSIFQPENFEYFCQSLKTIGTKQGFKRKGEIVSGKNAKFRLKKKY